MRLRPEEPPAGPWKAVPYARLLDLVLPGRTRAAEGPAVLAIDGRSSSGKTSLARRLVAVIPSGAVVHTDDLAWWHSRFGWTDLLVDGVIEPWRSGHTVALRPPAWDERGREGTISVAGRASLLIVEGVGASRRELRPWFDASVWVQADEAIIAERNAVRVATGETTSGGLAGWMNEELRFLAEDRPWERATATVAGTAEASYDDATEVLVAERKGPQPLT